MSAATKGMYNSQEKPMHKVKMTLNHELTNYVGPYGSITAIWTLIGGGWSRVLFTFDHRVIASILWWNISRRHSCNSFVPRKFLIVFDCFVIDLGVFIVGAKRTAFGTFGGTLKNVSGTQLQAHACKATLEAAGVRPDQVDSVVIGNVLVVRIFSRSTV